MANSALNAHLRELIEESSQSLPGVTWRRMFGCDAAFANGNIYALVWKDGRIGLKLPDRERFEALMSLEGSSPWTPGGMNPMSKWILVPESFHDDAEALTPWVREAHAAAASEQKDPTPKKKAPGKRASATKRRTATKK